MSFEFKPIEKFLLSLNFPLFRFARAIHKAFDTIENDLAADPPNTPAALLTISGSPKFFSNGIDPAWMATAPRSEIAQWVRLFHADESSMI